MKGTEGRQGASTGWVTDQVVFTDHCSLITDHYSSALSTQHSEPSITQHSALPRESLHILLFGADFVRVARTWGCDDGPGSTDHWHKRAGPWGPAAGVGGPPRGAAETL